MVGRLFLSPRAALGIALLLIALVGAACAGAAPTPTPTATPTPTPTLAPGAPTPTPTATPTPRPLETPVARPTPTPTTAFTPTPTPVKEQIKRGGTLVMSAYQVRPYTADLQTQFSGFANQVLVFGVYNGILTTSKAEGNPIVGMMAEGWEWSADGRKLTIHLRPGMKFHDGSAVTAADVAYSIERQWDPEAAKGIKMVLRAGLTPIESIETPDGLTVVLNTSRPAPDLVSTLAGPNSSVHPKRIAEPLDQQGLGLKEVKAQNMIGAGPFKFKSLVTEQVFKFERFDDYFKPGLPYMDGYDVVFMADESLRSAALRARRIDAGISQFNNVPVYRALAKEPGIIVQEYMRSIAVLFYFNYNPETGYEPFWDKRVRQAISYCINRDAFAEVAGPINGAGFVGGLVLPGLTGSFTREELEQYPGYGTDIVGDRAKARQLLADAGYEPEDLAFSIKARPTTHHKDSALTALDLLKKCGLTNATVKILDHAVYYDDVLAEKPRFDAGVHSAPSAMPTVDSMLGDLFSPMGVRNYGQYEDQKLRDMYAQQSQELDLAKRAQLVREYQDYFLTNAFNINTAFRGLADAYLDDIRGFGKPQPDGRTQGFLEDVWLDR